MEKGSVSEMPHLPLCNLPQSTQYGTREWRAEGGRREGGNLGKRSFLCPSLGASTLTFCHEMTSSDFYTIEPSLIRPTHTLPNPSQPNSNKTSPPTHPPTSTPQNAHARSRRLDRGQTKRPPNHPHMGRYINPPTQPPTHKTTTN